MGIKVKFNDGLVEVGGEFTEALAWVKSLQGRKYDSSTKTWSCPAEMQATMRYCSFPYDVLAGDGSNGKYRSGNHVTKYGSVYSREEWQQAQEIRSIQLEGDYSRQLDDAYGQLLAELRATGALEKVVVGIACEIQDGNSIAWLEEAGKIVFTSLDRRQAFVAAEEKYFEAIARISRAEGDELATKEELIFEKYDIY